MPYTSDDETETVVWITGATSGIGAALVEHVPFKNARVINISRSKNPGCENVAADFTNPDDWQRVSDHLATEFASFSAKRAIFIHNAFVPATSGYVGTADAIGYQAQVLGNVAAPLVMGDAFLRHCPTDVDAGLLMVSSAAARVPYPGLAGYGAAKAAMEQWVKAVRLELADRRPSAWVVAIRPGAVDTPSFRAGSEQDDWVNPTASLTKAALEAGQVDSADFAAQSIWSELPPDPASRPVVFLGEMVAPPESPSS